MNYIFNKNNDEMKKLTEDVSRVLLKFPDRIPIILTRDEKSNDIPLIDDKKYIKFLVPNDLTVGQFLFTIRKRVSLPAEKAIFLFIYNDGKYILPATASTLLELYNKYKYESGFILMKYSSENTFG